jgi:hypothetical protein
LQGSFRPAFLARPGEQKERCNGNHAGGNRPRLFHEETSRGTPLQESFGL